MGAGETSGAVVHRVGAAGDGPIDSGLNCDSALARRAAWLRSQWDIIGRKKQQKGVKRHTSVSLYQERTGTRSMKDDLPVVSRGKNADNPAPV